MGILLEDPLNVNALKAVRGTCRTLVLLILVTTPAFANQPPGPNVALAEVLMLPLMALLTAVGGGYAILRARKTQSKFPRVANWLIVVVLLLFGFTHEGFSVMVTILFGYLAVSRGVRMIAWGTKSRTPAGDQATGEQAPNISSVRLKTAGVLLILIALFLVGDAIAFVGYWPGFYQNNQESQLKKFLASEIAYGRAQKQTSGNLRFYPVKPDDTSHWAAQDLAKGKNVRIEFAPDNKHFTVYILPYSHFPPWPYRLFTTQHSYRGDETGEIRMISVRRQDQICPPNAPVVMKVDEQDIRDAVNEQTGAH